MSFFSAATQIGTVANGETVEEEKLADRRIGMQARIVELRDRDRRCCAPVHNKVCGNEIGDIRAVRRELHTFGRTQLGCGTAVNAVLIHRYFSSESANAGKRQFDIRL